MNSIGLIGLLVTIIQPGIGEANVEDEGVSDKATMVKQIVLSSPFNNQPNYQQYQPSVQQIQPSVQQIQPSAQQIQPVVISQDYVRYAPVSPDSSSRSPANWSLLLAMLYILGAFTPTSTTTAVSPSVTCIYGQWGACSATCKGQETRTRICGDVPTTETRDCNTQLGFLSDGWYRAANCYDYVVSGPYGDYDYATTACQQEGARLASAGLRDDEIRMDLMIKLHSSTIGPVPVYIGAERSGTDWLWSDGDTSVPTFFDVNQPSTDTTRNSMQIYTGNAYSGSLLDGINNRRYMCEREAI